MFRYKQQSVAILNYVSVKCDHLVVSRSKKANDSCVSSAKELARGDDEVIRRAFMRASNMETAADIWFSFMFPLITEAVRPSSFGREEGGSSDRWRQMCE